MAYPVWRPKRAPFERRLLKWFRAHRRDLPWRANGDPYQVWVAEIMLQQTRVAVVLRYYHRFLENFPTLGSLAAARQEEVLRLWSGLGYYSRARNLYRAAKEVVANHGSQFPHRLEDALGLPGIGRYTAAAVLSIAYHLPLAALDGNVARVLARLAAVRGNLRAPEVWRQLAQTADRLLARKAPGEWNQALMELGETICTPQNPRCDDCPVSGLCRARMLHLAHEIPSARPKRAAVGVRIAAAVLRDPSGRTILVRDPGAHDGVLFSRLWQFPAVEVGREPQVELEKHLRELFRLDSVSLQFEALPAARHAVTFRQVLLLPFLVRVTQLPRLPRTRTLALGRILELPVSAATRKIAAAAGP
jgi:A/G-specific adenine glycosylase